MMTEMTFFWLSYLFWMNKQSDCSHLNWSYSSSSVWSFVKSHQNVLHKTYYTSLTPWNWCLLTGTTKWSILVPALKDLISLPQSTTQCLSDWEFRVQVVAHLILYIHNTQQQVPSTKVIKTLLKCIKLQPLQSVDVGNCVDTWAHPWFEKCKSKTSWNKWYLNSCFKDGCGYRCWLMLSQSMWRTQECTQEMPHSCCLHRPSARELWRRSQLHFYSTKLAVWSWFAPCHGRHFFFVLFCFSITFKK